MPGSSAAAGSAAKPKALADRKYVPSNLSLEKARKWLAPASLLVHVPDTKEGRLRCFYGTKDAKLSTGISLAGTTLARASMELIRWSWDQHKAATGTAVPYMFEK